MLFIGTQFSILYTSEKVREKMVKGNSKKRGLMLARDRARSSVFPQIARSGGRRRWRATGGLASTCKVRTSKPLETCGLLHHRATTAEMAADCF